SEVGAISINLDADPTASAHTVGRPLENVTVTIDGADAASGEVVVRSASTTNGYWGDPESNGVAFVDGAFRTGDIGALDEEGRLCLTGRRRLWVEIAGHKVDPYEVEDVLALHPDVREVVVVGVR